MPLYTKDLVCVKCLRPCTRQKRRGGVSNSKKLLHSIFFKGNPRNRGQRDSVSPARRFSASQRSRGHWSETESGNDSGKAGELSTSGCPSVNHLFICPEWERFCYANKERSPSENVMTDVVDAFVCSRSKIIRGTSYRRRGWNDLTGQVLNHPS